MNKMKIRPNVTPCPMPMTLVGANVDEKPNFMPTAWINRLNNRPPIWGAGINAAHHTPKGIKENKTFSVNIPSVDLVEKTDYCGLGSGIKVDKSDVFEVFYGDLETAPMISECPLNIECRLYDIVELPTNLLVLGEVVAAYTEDKYLTDDKVDIKKLRPFVLTMPDNSYWKVGERIAGAWSIGKQFKS